MTCKKCEAARETRGNHCWFDPLCLYCGARLIQTIGKLPISVEDSIRRRRAVLLDWVAQGHADADLRRLAKLDVLPITPEVSLVKPAKHRG